MEKFFGFDRLSLEAPESQGQIWRSWVIKPLRRGGLDTQGERESERTVWAGLTQNLERGIE